MLKRLDEVLQGQRRRKGVIAQATVFCQQIQLQSQRISYLRIEMGNSFEGRQNLLAKNWSKVQGNKYRNIITEQLIDEHTIEYQNEEEMMHNSSLLMKRANFNHPNIIKLIYFHQDSLKPICVNRLYRHRIFVEHQEVQLENVMKSQKESPALEECLCCPIISGLAFLAQKYGNFLVKQSMIFVSSQAGWQRKADKHSAKVWINSQPSSNEPEIICNEQQMCQKIAIIFKRMFQHKLCQQIEIQQLHRFYNIQQLVKYIYQLHNLSPVKEVPKKRVLSNASFNGQPTTTAFKTLTTQQFSQESLHQRYTRSYSNYVKPDTEELATNDKTRGQTGKGSFNQLNNFLKKKELISPTVSSKNLLKDHSRDSIFYKPQNSSFKVNFSYKEDNTPKQNKSYQQITVQRKMPVTPPQNKQHYSQFAQPFGNNIHFRENLTVTPIKIKEQKRQQPQKKFVSPQEAIRIEEQDLKKALEEIVLTERQLPLQELDEDKSQNYVGSEQKHKTISEQDQQEPEVKIQPPPHLEFLKQSDPFSNFGKQRQASYENFVIQEQTPQQSQQTIHHPSNPIISMSFETLQSKYAEDSNEVPSPGKFGFKQEYNHDFLPSFREEQKRYTSRDYNKGYGNLDNSYNKYLQKFEQIVKPHESIKANYYSKQDKGTLNKSNSHKFSQKVHKADSLNHPFSNPNDAESEGHMRFSDDNAFTKRQSQFVSSRGKEIKSGELESVYNESEYSEEEDRKAKIIERIQNTEKIIRENRKKLEKIQLEKDLQRQKEMIKKEMESLLKNNLMSDETNRIKEKVKHKKATFAELKAEASKILEDLNF